MGHINTFTLKQYKECYPDLLERHKLEYEDYNEFTFISSELEYFHDGLIYIDGIEDFPWQFKISNSFTDAELQEAIVGQREFKEAAIKSNLSYSLIIDFLEQRRQEIEDEQTPATAPFAENIKILRSDEELIFKNDIGFSIFSKMFEIYKTETNDLANFSFLFYAMEKDFLVCSQTEFREFLRSEKYNIDIDKIDSRQSGNNKKTKLYNSIKEKYLNSTI